MPAPPLEEMRRVASRLKPLNVPSAFVGGAVTCLLVDHPELTDFRRTKDVDVVVAAIMRIPMKADTCSNPYRTPFQSCRTVVGAKRRSESLIKGCPTAVKSSPPISGSFGAPSRGDAWTVHPSASSRRLFGRAVSGGNKRPNSSSGCRRSLRVTDSPARPNRRAWD
jgi:hypothetical protein